MVRSSRQTAADRKKSSGIWNRKIEQRNRKRKAGMKRNKHGVRKKGKEKREGEKKSREEREGRLESLTICRCYYKGSTFSSVILRP